MTTYKRRIFSIIGTLFVFDLLIWQQILFVGLKNDAAIFALDVGQGDSELVILPNGEKVLIDGGPSGKKLLANLEKVLGVTDRYIDLAILSHPETDHFTGLIDVFKKYKVGALIFNGKEGEADSYTDFKKAVLKNGSQRVAISENDKIIFGNSFFEIFWPASGMVDGLTTNESALVLKFQTPGAKALFTGDIGEETEAEILKKHDVDADILKVAHHGSKFSSSDEFLEAVTPKISFIEVGAKNSYGHPTSEALANIYAVGSKIFRTDEDGTVKFAISSSSVRISKEKK